MFTTDQLVVHLIGDYILQSDWMAINKVKRSWPCLVHVWFYSIGFITLSPSLYAWLTIAITHFFIDRFRLARYVVWLKNFIAPSTNSNLWKNCSKTGYPNERPDWLAVWLLIIADNILHICINSFALKYL